MLCDINRLLLVSSYSLSCLEEVILQKHYDNALAPGGSCFSLIMASASCHMDSPPRSPCPHLKIFEQFLCLQNVRKL